MTTRCFGWAGTWTDIDDIKNLEHKLGGIKRGSAASLAILDALQATVPLGIGLVDREFRIVHMNDLLHGLNGTSPEEAQGRTLAEVLGSVWPRVQPHYQQVLNPARVSPTSTWHDRGLTDCPATG